MQALKRYRTVEAYDVHRKNWINIAPMRNKRSGHGVAVVGAHLYAVGGHDGYSYLDSMERYNFVDNTWTMMPPMPEPRNCARVVQLDDKIYVIGGYNERSGYLNSVAVFDTINQTWKEGTPMLSKRNNCGVAVLNNKIFACGGNTTSTTLEMYDPEKDGWCYLQNMNEGRCGFGLVAVMNNLFAIGGFTRAGHSDTVEKYCPESDTWSYVKSMKLGRAALGVGVLPRI